MLTLDEVRKEALKDPEVKREYDALEGWYQEALRQQDALNARKPKKHIAHPYKKRPLAAV